MRATPPSRAGLIRRGRFRGRELIRGQRFVIEAEGMNLGGFDAAAAASV